MIALIIVIAASTAAITQPAYGIAFAAAAANGFSVNVIDAPEGMSSILDNNERIENALTDINEAAEIHIFDFDEDIYGLDLKVTFIARIREEVRFESMDALRAQLEKDRDACLSLI